MLRFMMHNLKLHIFTLLEVSGGRLDDKCYEADRICFPVNSITDCTLTQTHDDCIPGWIIFHFLLWKMFRPGVLRSDTITWNFTTELITTENIINATPWTTNSHQVVFRLYSGSEPSHSDKSMIGKIRKDLGHQPTSNPFPKLISANIFGMP